MPIEDEFDDIINNEEDDPLKDYRPAVPFIQFSRGVVETYVTKYDIDLSIYHEHQRDLLSQIPSKIPHKGLMIWADTSFGKTFLMPFFAEYIRNVSKFVPVILTLARMHDDTKRTFENQHVTVPRIITTDDTRARKKLIDCARDCGRKNMAIIIDECHRLIVDNTSMIAHDTMHFLYESRHVGAIIGLSATIINTHPANLNFLAIFLPPILRSDFATHIPISEDDFDKKYIRQDNGLYNWSFISSGLRGWVIPGTKKEGDVPAIKGPVKVLSLFKYDIIEHLPDKNEVQRKAIGKILSELDSKFQHLIGLIKSSKGVIVVSTEYISSIKSKWDEYVKKEDIKYAFLSSQQTQSEVKDLFKRINSSSNINGEIIKVVFIGPSFSEGISCLTARDLVYLEPPINYGTYRQVLGRVRRDQSLKMLPQNDRVINVWIYCAIVEPNNYNNNNKKELDNVSEIYTTIEEKLYDEYVKQENIYLQLEELRKALKIKKQTNREVGGGYSTSFSSTESELLSW